MTDGLFISAAQYVTEYEPWDDGVFLHNNKDLYKIQFCTITMKTWMGKKSSTPFLIIWSFMVMRFWNFLQTFLNTVSTLSKLFPQPAQQQTTCAKLLTVFTLLSHKMHSVMTSFTFCEFVSHSNSTTSKSLCIYSHFSPHMLAKSFQNLKFSSKPNTKQLDNLLYRPHFKLYTVLPQWNIFKTPLKIKSILNNHSWFPF